MYRKITQEFYFKLYTYMNKCSTAKYIQSKIVVQKVTLYARGRILKSQEKFVQCGQK